MRQRHRTHRIQDIIFADEHVRRVIGCCGSDKCRQSKQEIFVRREGRVRAHVREALKEGLPSMHGSRQAAENWVPEGFIHITALRAVFGVIHSKSEVRYSKVAL